MLNDIRGFVFMFISAYFMIPGNSEKLKVFITIKKIYKPTMPKVVTANNIFL